MQDFTKIAASHSIFIAYERDVIFTVTKIDFRLKLSIVLRLFLHRFKKPPGSMMFI